VKFVKQKTNIETVPSAVERSLGIAILNTPVRRDFPGASALQGGSTMPNARQVIDRKGRDVVTITPDASVLEAARLMNENKIGALIVTVDGALLGIFTERDIMQRVVAAQRDPSTTAVEHVMTHPVACAAPNTTTNEMASVMRDKRIRHLPVVDDGKVVGIVSIGDINRSQNSVHEQTIQYLEQYISVA
jgi:CBS domain-containing protein